MNYDHAPSKESEWKCPDTGLATTSVVLALVMEAPCGIESGLIYGMLSESSIYPMALSLFCKSLRSLTMLVFFVSVGGTRIMTTGTERN